MSRLSRHVKVRNGGPAQAYQRQPHTWSMSRLIWCISNSRGTKKISQSSRSQVRRKSTICDSGAEPNAMMTSPTPNSTITLASDSWPPSSGTGRSSGSSSGSESRNPTGFSPYSGWASSSAASVPPMRPAPRISVGWATKLRRLTARTTE